MSFQDKINYYLNEIRALETSFQEVQGKEILPLSFFSSSMDTLYRLRTGILEIEAIQLRTMQEHLKKSEIEWNEAHPVEAAAQTIVSDELAEQTVLPEKPKLKSEEGKTVSGAGVLGEIIGRKINADFGKSLSLNDRFMFRRNLFQGNANAMNKALLQLDSFHTLNDALDYLDTNYSIRWDSDSGIVFRDLLDKHFS
jgi:hypothetical protein